MKAFLTGLWILISSFFIIFLVSLIAGAFLSWGNSFAMVRPIYEHFGIDGLTYSNYVFGSWILGTIFKLMFQTNLKLDIEKKN